MGAERLYTAHSPGEPVGMLPQFVRRTRGLNNCHGLSLDNYTRAHTGFLQRCDSVLIGSASGK